MEPNTTCPSCGKPIGPDAPQGLCPACLMRVGGGSFSVPAHGTVARTGGFEPPSVTDLARLFPQLEILELIGKGGMGAVYKARQRDLDRLVALKVLPAQVGTDPGFADRFTREARALARLNHPHIVAVHDFGQCGGFHYFIMEYVDGTNLRQVESAGGLSPRQALAIIPQICEALQFAHDKGIVHRDIKPENILLDREGRVKIADFGLAKLLGGDKRDLTLTAEGQVMGTPHYMAPEQVEHPQEVDHRADIYSLGVVFYEMLTGELPLGKFSPPSQKVQIDVRLDEVVLRALEKEPERRYQHASQVKTEVETIATSPEGRPQAATPSLSGEAFKVEHVRPLVLAIAGLLCLVGGAKWLKSPSSSTALRLAICLVGLFVVAWRPAFRVCFKPLELWYYLGSVILGRLKGGATVRTLILCAAACTAGFIWIPLIVEHRLPDRPSDLMWGPITAVILMALLLAARWWRRGAGSDAGTDGGPRWPTVAALSATVFYAGMTLGVATVWALPWGGGLNLAWSAVMVVALPFIIVVANRCMQRWQAVTPAGERLHGVHWLKAWAWTAWALAIPVVGFGLFFLRSFVSSIGPWNPARDEAVIVPLIWLGSLLLPLSGWVLLRAAWRVDRAVVCGSRPEQLASGAPPEGGFSAERSRWITSAHWTARILGLLGFVFVLAFILAEGFPRFLGQPLAVQVELAATVEMLTGLLLGWRWPGWGAILIADGWLVFLIAEQGWPPIPYTAFLIVAGLYAWSWWRGRDRSRPLPLEGQAAINKAEWQDPKNWTGPRWLSLYFSKRDCRVWVPKQIPAMGWTVNLGHPKGLAVLLALIILLSFLPAIIPYFFPGRDSSAKVNDEGTKTFGAVREVVFGDEAGLKDCFLDLDSGQLLSAPKDLVESLRSSGRLDDWDVDVPVIQDWLRNNGVDLVRTRQDLRVIGGGSILAEGEPSRAFDSLTAADLVFKGDYILQVIENTGGSRPDVPVLTSLEKKGRTYVIQTRSGRTGLVQVLEDGLHQGRSRLRYKLVDCGPIEAGRFVAHLPFGVTVELLGVCEHPSEGKRWWRPDGTLLEESPYDDDLGRAFPRAGEKGYKFAIRLSGMAGKEIDVHVMPLGFRSTNGGAMGFPSEKNGQKNVRLINGSVDEEILWMGAAMAKERECCHLVVGISYGRWKEHYRYETDQPWDGVEWVVFTDVSLMPGIALRPRTGP